VFDAFPLLERSYSAFRFIQVDCKRSVIHEDAVTGTPADLREISHTLKIAEKNPAAFAAGRWMVEERMLVSRRKTERAHQLHEYGCCREHE
jgi:hypothetical protein